MNETVSLTELAVYRLELDHSETDYDSADAICDYFKTCIESHRSAVFIGELDHYAHTRSLPEGYIGEDIRAAKNLIFCFGISLPKPELLACRPRSIGIAETDAGFVITFLEPPMPVANAVMEDWASGLLKVQTASR